jgi:hypothetical protein
VYQNIGDISGSLVCQNIGYIRYLPNIARLKLEISFRDKQKAFSAQELLILLATNEKVFGANKSLLDEKNSEHLQNRFSVIICGKTQIHTIWSARKNAGALKFVRKRKHRKRN